MRRTLLILVFLIIAVASTAQTISFLGVPLSGNIRNFTEKLAVKGTRVNKNISNKLEEGMRAFDVSIFPYTCQALVLYNPSTRNVYEATLMFHISTTLKEFSAFYDNWSNQIDEKYSKGIYVNDYEQSEYKSIPADHYTIYSSKNNTKIGEIYLYVDIKDYSETTDKGYFLFQIMYRNSEAPSFIEQMQDIY